MDKHTTPECIQSVEPLASQFRLDGLVIGQPHQKPFLTTRFGRLVERASYLYIFLLALATLFSSTVYFFCHHQEFTSSLKEHDLGKPYDLAMDALYFSVVTFTSLGYGDYAPNGLGRFVASCVTLLGLTLTALFVGKVASERQFSLLLLLQTSDAQRRLIGFCDDLVVAGSTIELAKTDVAGDGLDRSLREMANLLDSITKYVLFQSHQAQLATFGNGSALKALYEHLEAAQLACMQVFRSPQANLVVGKRCVKVVVQAAEIVTLLVMFQNRQRRPSRRPTGPADTVTATLPVAKNVEKLCDWATTHITDWLLDQALNRLPTTPLDAWGSLQHVTLAKDLGISDTLARKCIGTLIAGGQLPRKPKHEINTSRTTVSGRIRRHCNALNNGLLHMDRAMLKGSPLLASLEKCLVAVTQSRKFLIVSRTHAAWRLEDPATLTMFLSQCNRMLHTALSVRDSAVYTEREKTRADELSLYVAELSHIGFCTKFGVEPELWICAPLRPLLSKYRGIDAIHVTLVRVSQPHYRRLMRRRYLSKVA